MRQEHKACRISVGTRARPCRARLYRRAEERRPDPDALLAATRQRGRLKLFFGANAGVGKTYAMLQEAQRLRAQGLDVLVGIVETHGRSETAALLEGLAVQPLYHHF